MSDLIFRLAEAGIRPVRGRSFSLGDNYTTCPECSADRKPENRAKPCLTVTLDDGGGAVWNCHHCGHTGNVPQLDRGSRRDMQPIQRPAYRPARQVTEEERRQRPDDLMAFFASRGIAADVVEEMGVYGTKRRFPQDYHLGGDPIDWPKVPVTPAIAFPYTIDGVVVNHKYRDAQKRFAQDPKARRSLYNLDQVEKDVVIWVEGEMDVLACMTAGYRSVVTLPDGAPKKARTEEDAARAADKRFRALEDTDCAAKMEGVQKFVIAVDGDGPGNALAEELARRFGKDRCWRVYWPEGCKDANDTLLHYGADALQHAIESARPYPMEGLWDLEPGTLLRLRNSPKAKTYSTGYCNLDDLIRIPDEGRLWVVTGIPNSGKSEWVDAVLVNTAMAHGWHATICSPENNPVEMHAAKLAEKWAGEPFASTLHDRGMSDEVLRDAEEWIGRHFTFIRADKLDQALTVDWILDRASKSILRRGSRWLVIDPWNRLEHRRPSNMTETEYIGQALDKLAKWASSHSCNVVLIAHPQKLRVEEGKVRVPGGYDVSGSANFYNMPDFGITIHRPDQESPVVEVHVWKVRFKHHGRKGKGYLRWVHHNGRYEPSSEEELLSKSALMRGSRDLEDYPI